MIGEVDAALRALLRQNLPRETAVRFEAPTPTWLTETHPTPTAHLFLFELRDDPRGRVSGWEDVRDAEGRVRGRQPPARRYELSYLVTARADDIEREHVLLDQVLRICSSLESIPAEHLPEELVATGQPVLLRLADPGGGGLWSALGMPARAAFVIAVSAALRPALDTELAPAADEINLGVARTVPRQPNPLAPSGGGRWSRSKVDEG